MVMKVNVTIIKEEEGKVSRCLQGPGYWAMN